MALTRIGTVSTAPGPARKSGGDLADSLYRAIVDTAVDGIVVIDRTGTIRSINTATERLFGYAA
ncbi:MAG: PAS domain S-box protein, partial [Alphaproteobacteria bacterium]|nr:PAS domain S-box protein [Alphaproteobacteria bacterium]